MARQSNARYISFYTDGSAARKIEVSKPAVKSTLPKKKRRKKIVLYVDPIAILGIMTAVVMTIIMTVSLFMLRDAQAKAVAMEQQAMQLRAENLELQAEYEAGYNLEQVEQTALALGMVPKDQVEHVTLYVQPTPTQKTVSPLAQLWSFLSGLFA